MPNVNSVCAIERTFMRRRLELLLNELPRCSPDDLARELARLSKLVSPEVLLEQEFTSFSGPFGGVVNNKSGQSYLALGHAIEATNSDVGREKVIYCRSGSVYVRNADEFSTKFVFV